MFLGGINVGSGNRPPWSLPAKANYFFFDGARAKKYFGETKIQTPDFFPILSVLVCKIFHYVYSEAFKIYSKSQHLSCPLSCSRFIARFNYPVPNFHICSHNAPCFTSRTTTQMTNSKRPSTPYFLHFGFRRKVTYLSLLTSKYAPLAHI